MTDMFKGNDKLKSQFIHASQQRKTLSTILSDITAELEDRCKSLSPELAIAERSGWVNALLDEARCFSSEAFGEEITYQTFLIKLLGDKIIALATASIMASKQLDGKK